MLKRIFAPGSNSACASLGLLVLRAWLGATMLLHHGIPKLTGFNSMAGGFPDPLGVGHTTSLALATFAEVLGAALLVFGLVTRFAALVLAFHMAVAFFVIHKASLNGEHSGELAFVYLAGFVALLIAGGGSFSLDKFVFKGGSSKGSK